MSPQHQYRLARTALAILGVAAVYILVSHILAAARTMPGFSWLTHFISTLAAWHNPGREQLNQGFMMGGALTAATMVAFGLVTRARGPATVGVLAGICVVLVGVYPLERVAPHFACASLLVVCVLVATALWWRALRRAGPSRTAAARATAALLAIQIGSVLGGALGFVAIVSTRGMPRSIGGLTVRLGDRWVNPVAAFEWVFFAAALVALAGLAVATPWRAPAGRL